LEPDIPVHVAVCEKFKIFSISANNNLILFSLLSDGKFKQLIRHKSVDSVDQEIIMSKFDSLGRYLAIGTNIGAIR
jgi:hypothetical protein